MNKSMNKLITFFVFLLMAGSVYAVTLQEAKSQGLVGEQRDGYVGLVTEDAPAEVVALVRQVNEERRERYAEIARENGITMAQVTSLAYERAVAATQPGHFIQLPNGEWVRK